MRTGPFGLHGPFGLFGTLSRTLPYSAVLSLAVLTGASLGWPASARSADGGATGRGATGNGGTENGGTEGVVRLGGGRPGEGVVRLAVDQEPFGSGAPGAEALGAEAAGTVQLGPGSTPFEQAPAPELEGDASGSGPLELYSSNPWSDSPAAGDMIGSPGHGGMPGETHSGIGGGMAGPMLGPLWCDEDCAPQVPAAYWTGHYYLGDGIGYRDGYWTFGFFTPIYQPEPDRMIYTNTQMITTFDGRLGTNVGLGYRSYWERFIAGANVWYDADESDSGLRYDQITAGVELLTTHFDIVANGYFPLNTDTHQSGITRGMDPMFAGNRIVFTDITRQEAALTGGDFQIGFPVLGNPWLKTWLGAYIYDPKNADAEVGFRAIVRGRVTQAASAEVRVTDDDIFGTNVILGVNYNFNAKKLRHWTPSKCFQWYRQPCLADRMYEQPLRYYRIAVREQVGAVIQSPAINPQTGQPLSVVHVDATSPAGGTGTVERPFNTLAAASGANADLVLVQQEGTSATNPLLGPIALNDSTRLLGEGAAHFFTAQDRGTFQLPAPFEATGPAPFIAAPGSNVVTLADNNEVNSFNILTDDGFAGIAGTEVDNFRIENINQGFTGTTGTGSGIVLTDVAGTGFIEDVRFNSPDKDPGEAGVRLVADGEALNVTVNRLDADSNANGIELRAVGGGTLTASVSDSSFDDAGTAAPVAPDQGIAGILIEADDTSTVDADFVNVTANDSEFNAVRIFGNGNIAALFDDLTADRAASDGVFIQMGTAGGGPTTIDFDFIGNSSVQDAGQLAGAQFGLDALFTDTTGDLLFGPDTIITDIDDPPAEDARITRDGPTPTVTNQSPNVSTLITP